MANNPISARLHYATIAMIELALQYQRNGLTCVRDIADNHNIPLPFLTQILNQLRSYGLVSSVRGASGGYKLSRPPEAITMADIASVWSCPSENVHNPRASAIEQLSHNVWLDAHNHSQQYLESIRLDALLEQATSASNMFHI